MNYSKNPRMVRVDFFKQSGKWEATEEMLWRHWDGTILIHDAFLWSLISQFNSRYEDMTAVCLQPYHENAHPVMIYNWNTQKPAPIKLV